MKQKAVKYHNPINAEVRWKVPPERSAGNAHENNQSGVKVCTTVGCVGARTTSVQRQEQNGCLFYCLLPVSSLTKSQSELVRECLQVNERSPSIPASYRSVRFFVTQSEPGCSAPVYFKQLVVCGFNSVKPANNIFPLLTSIFFFADNNKNQTKLSSIFSLSCF